MEPGKKTYSWVLSPSGMICYRNPESYQTVGSSLWEAMELTSFHDAELAGATKEINAILSTLEKDNKDAGRKLSFIRFKNRHFLVWARYGAVGQQDEDETIVNKLKLKVE